MAKIVKVRYGLSKLSQKEYLYMVNDNVRKGNVLMPTVNRWPQRGPYSTMAVVQGSLNMNANKNKELVKNEVENSKNGTLVGADKLTREEVNKITPQLRDKEGKYMYTGNAGKGITGTGKMGEVVYGYSEQQNIYAQKAGEERQTSISKDNKAYQEIRQEKAEKRIEADESGKSYEDFQTYASKYFK